MKKTKITVLKNNRFPPVNKIIWNCMLKNDIKNLKSVMCACIFPKVFNLIFRLWVHLFKRFLYIQVHIQILWHSKKVKMCLFFLTFRCWRCWHFSWPWFKFNSTPESVGDKRGRGKARRLCVIPESGHYCSIQKPIFSFEIVTL